MARFGIRKWCEKMLGTLKRRWQASWLIRFAVLAPIIVALCVIAYDKEGIEEFFTLFAIPFLVTAIFPQGFGSYSVAFAMAYLASHGFEGVVENLSRLFPQTLMEIYREKRIDTLKAMARHRRSVIDKTSDAFAAWKAHRKQSKKAPPP
jgi:hypothetical protein